MALIGEENDDCIEKADGCKRENRNKLLFKKGPACQKDDRITSNEPCE